MKSKTEYIKDFIMDNYKKGLINFSFANVSEFDDSQLYEIFLKDVELVDCEKVYEKDKGYDDAIIITTASMLNGVGGTDVFLSSCDETNYLLDKIYDMVHEFKMNILKNYTNNADYIPISIVKNDTNVTVRDDENCTEIKFYTIVFVSKDNSVLSLIYNIDEDLESDIGKFISMFNKSIYNESTLSKIRLWTMDDIFDNNILKIVYDNELFTSDILSQYCVYINDIYCGSFLTYCSKENDTGLSKEFKKYYKKGD